MERRSARSCRALFFAEEFDVSTSLPVAVMKYSDKGSIGRKGLVGFFYKEDIRRKQTG